MTHRLSSLCFHLACALVVSWAGIVPSPSSSATGSAASTTTTPSTSTSGNPSLAEVTNNPPPAGETTVATASPDDDGCYDQIAYNENPELLERLKQYDVAKVLEELGGAPGKVNVTWKDRSSVPEFLDSELERPQGVDAVLPDTDNQTFWLYNYKSSDLKRYIRLEHALVRAKGTTQEYVDVRGEVYWTPEDLCGSLRHAKYRLDQHGFVADVLRAHCTIFKGSQELSCFGPDSENPCGFCISGLSGTLIASLVG